MSRPESVDHGADDVGRIASCLLGGGIVLLPTDTVYGLAVHPTFPESVERLFQLKRRSRSRQLPVMIAAEDALAGMGVRLTEPARRVLRSPLVPGALTLVLGFADGPVPSWLAGREEVAIRIPDDRRLLAVLRRTGPLFVTSANTHGAATPESLADALAQLDGAPGLAIDGGTLRTVPSTLLNCRRDPPVVEREGAISTAELMALLR
jgi:L-threonylcarbamoyladenylate synthase